MSASNRREAQYATYMEPDDPNASEFRRYLGKLADPASCDITVFHDFRRFCFKMKTMGFQALCKANTEVIADVAKAFITGAKQANNSEKVGEMLWLLSFMGFKFRANTKAVELLGIVCGEIESGSIENVAKIVRLLRYSIEVDDEKMDITAKLNVLAKVFISIGKRFARWQEVLVPASQDSDAALSGIFALLMASRMWYDKLKPQVDGILAHIPELLKYRIPQECGICQKVMINSMKVKALMVWFSFACIAVRGGGKQTAHGKMATAKLLSILDGSPLCFPTLVEEILNAFLMVLKQEQSQEPLAAKIVEEGMPFMFNVSLCHHDIVAVASNVIAMAYENRNTDRTLSDQEKINRYIYTMNLFHSTLTPSQLTKRVSTFQSLLKPVSDKSITKSLIILWCFSTDLAVRECYRALNRLKRDMVKQDDVKQLVTQLVVIGDKFLKCQRFLSGFLAKLPMSQGVSSPHELMCSEFSVTEWEVITNAVTSCLIFGIRYRVVLQEDYARISQFDSSSDPDKCYRKLTQHRKILDIYDNAQKMNGYHIAECAAMINMLPYNATLNVWDTFFRIFFTTKGHGLVLSSSIFTQIVNTTSRLKPFLEAIFTCVSTALAKEHSPGKVLRVRYLFHNMSIKYEGEVGPELTQKVNELGTNLFLATKDYLLTSKYSDRVICLIWTTCVFLDKVLDNHAFSKLVLKESFVAEVFRLLALANTWTKNVVRFAVFCVGINPDFLKASFILDVLFSVTGDQIEYVLPLLKNFGKQNKDIYSHPLSIKFYAQLLRSLDDLKPEVKPIAMSVLKHMPENIYTDIWDEWNEMTTQRTLSLVGNGKELLVEQGEFLDALRQSVICPDSCVLIHAVYQTLISTICRDALWDMKQRKIVIDVFLGVLNMSEDGGVRKKVFCALLAQTEMNVQVYACAFVALCSACKNPDPEYVYTNLLVVRDCQSSTDFMKELQLMFTEQLVESRPIRQTIVTLLFQNISLDLIDSLCFALLVSQSVGSIAQGCRHSNCDSGKYKMSLFELAHASESSKEMIVNARNLLKEKPQSLSPLLWELGAYAGFKHMMVITEMMTECECVEEVMNIVDYYFSSDSLDVLAKVRVLGLVFRAFPTALVRRLEQAQNLFLEVLSHPKCGQLKDLSLFIAVVECEHETPADVLSNCLDRVLPLCRGTSLILQQQTVHLLTAIVKKGNASHLRKVCAFFEELLGKTDYPKSVSVQKWWRVHKCVAVLRGYFVVCPGKVVDTLLQYLGHLWRDIGSIVISKSAPSGDINGAIISLFDFIAQDEVVDIVVAQGLIDSLFDGIVNFLVSCPLIRTSKIASPIRRIVSHAASSFSDFVRKCFGKEQPQQFLNALLWIVDDPSVFEALNNVGFTPETIEKPVDMTGLSSYAAKLLIMCKLGCDVQEALGELIKNYLNWFGASPHHLSPALFTCALTSLADIDMALFLSLASHSFDTKQPIFAAAFGDVFSKRIESIDISAFKSATLTTEIQGRTAFFQKFATEYVVSHPELQTEMIAWAKETQPLYVFVSFLLALLDTPVKFDEPANQLLQRADSDEALFRTMLYWKKKANPEPELFSDIVTKSSRFIQLHMPHDVYNVMTSIQVPESGNLPDEFLQMFTSFIKHNNALSILMSLIAQKPEAFNCSCWCAVEDQMTNLEFYVMNQKPAVFQLLPSFYALSSIIPKESAEDLTEDVMYLLQHITFFTERCMAIVHTKYDEIPKLGYGFAKIYAEMGNLFGPTWPCGSKMMEIYLGMVKEKGTSPFIEYAADFIPTFVKGALTRSDFAKAEEFFALFDGTVAKRFGFLFASALYHFAESEHWSHLFKNKLEEYLKNTECFAHLWPALWLLFPDVTYGSLVQVLDACVAQATDSRGCTEIVLHYLCQYPLGNSNSLILEKVSTCAQQLENQKSVAFATKAIRIGLKKSTNASFRKMLFAIALNPKLCELYFGRQPLPLSEKMIREMPSEALYAVLPVILKEYAHMYHTIDIDTKWPNELASILNATAHEAAPIARHLANCTVSLCKDKRDSFMIRLRHGIRSFMTRKSLSSWGDVNEIDPEFCDSLSPSGVIFTPKLLWRMGFKQRAIQALQDESTVVSMDLSDLHEILSENCLICNQAIDVCVRNRENLEILKSELGRYIQNTALELKSSQLSDYLIMRHLKYIPKILAGQDLAKSHPFDIQFRSTETPIRVEAFSKVLSTVAFMLQNTKFYHLHANVLDQKRVETNDAYKRAVMMYNGDELTDNSPSRQWNERIAVALCESLDLRGQRAAFAAILDGLKKHPDSDIVWSALYQSLGSLEGQSTEVIASITKVPFHWSQLVVKATHAHPSFSGLLNLVDPAFYLDVIDSPHAPPAIKGTIDHFLAPINDLFEDEYLQAMKTNAESEMALASQFENGELLRDKIDIAHVDRSNSLLIKVSYTAPIHPPLINTAPGIKGARILVYQETPKDRYLTLKLLLSNGTSATYSLSPAPHACPRMTALSNLISRMMNQTPECVSRHQRVHTIYSTTLPHGFTLAALGDAKPLASTTHLAKMLALRRELLAQDAARLQDLPYPGHPTTLRLQFESKQSVCRWYSLFAAKFSAVSMLAVAARALPSPYLLSLDASRAGIALASLAPRQTPIVRLAGQLAPLCQPAFLDGPFKIGLMAAAQCLACNRRALRLHLRALFPALDASAFTSAATAFSARSTPAADAQRRVNELIARSAAAARTYAALPWI